MSSAALALEWEQHWEAPEKEVQKGWETNPDVLLEVELERAEGMVADRLEDDEPAILRKAFERATEFLRAQSRESERLWERFPPVPRISPGPNGSADLHWVQPGWGLLVNVPPTDAATFYGDRSGIERIKGSFDPKNYQRILSWLIGA